MKNINLKHLDISIERLNKESMFLALDGQELFYITIKEDRFFSNGEKIRIENPNYSEFFEKLELLDIWSLEKEYGSELIAKTWWHINIEYMDKTVVSCGVDIFPDMKNEEDSIFFKNLNEAIQKLIKSENNNESK
ncbi:MAG: hypothetical protein KAH01_02250 [Caldisericia bacterium]|nr:hypothetical protein [Caldisericia bacterium]